MKTIIKQVAVTFLAILLVSYIFRGIDFHNDLLTLLTASIMLALLNTFLKPFLKIILLPINIITLGFLGWAVNVLILYLVTQLVPQFAIIPFTLNLGQLVFSFSAFTAYFIIAFLINFSSRLVGWVID